MLGVRKLKDGWLTVDTKDGDEVHIRTSEIVWLVSKRNRKTWIVVRGSNETYLEVDSFVTDILAEME